MSSLWTPGGERPVGRPQPSPPPDGSPPGQPPAGRPPPRGGDEPEDQLSEADVEALRRQLAETPVDVVIANHAFGLFELAALHLSLQPPQLEQAQLAIDALGTLVEGLVGRLGAAEPTLKDGLAQLRVAFVQIKNAATA